MQIMNRTLRSSTLLHAMLITALASLSMVFPVADAATDLADVPLANATTLTIRPNIAFVLDDSGSMNDENMPDDNSTNKGSYCYKWYKYNSLAYNPGQTYNPPMKADGTRYPNASFTSAIKDGYFALSEKQFDGSTPNGTVDLTALGSVTSSAATIVFNSLGGSKYYVSSLNVTLLNGSQLELLNSAIVPSLSGTNDIDTLGQAVRDSINAKTAVTGFSASYDSDTRVLTINAPASQSGLSTTPALTRVKVSGSNKNVFISPFETTDLSSGFYYATHKTNPNSTTCANNSNYTVVTTPSGIAAPGATTGSAAALINYANWYSYYRKRAFLAKAGVGEAFASLEQDKFRVGLFFINSIESKAGSTNHDLAINTYSGTHRSNWFSRLYGARMDGWTPLRGALSRMGRMYAGKISGWDPVQYSCQKNYTILSTDGFWNDNAESDEYGPKQMDGTSNVGDMDGVAGVTRPSLDSSKAQNTLADVAYYYYHSDLRPGSCASPDICTDNVPPSGTNADVDDVAQHQHMTTFTVGFGVNGSLAYQEAYKTSTSGDYFAIKQGTKNWPNPVNGTNDDIDRVDDLWHAAVNGRGTYFSARDPVTLANGLAATLNTIQSVNGSGAAAATSNLQPTTGDNTIYIATYKTVKWEGEVGAYAVDLHSGAISGTPAWQASSLLAAQVASDGTSDTRTIYTADGTTRTLFKQGSGGLSSTQLAYFDNTLLSQYASWNSAQKATATSSLLVNYLRGQDRYEDQDRDAGYGAYQRLYRDRSKILGDIIHSQPIYVKTPAFDFTDSGYASFKNENQGRSPTLYVAANDGMLHAFDSETGQERWAYIPPIVLPQMWRLADAAYSNNHRFYLDGPLTISDAYINGGWKTVLIGALGKGGRGYYALDITNPANPQPLWNFSADTNSNVGYSYGTPFITKLTNGTSNGTWVAVVTSGYNNIPEGGKYGDADGKGYVFVLNLADGSILKTISTGVGSVDSPSGLAKINIHTANFSSNNTATGAYGGDLMGNMWRFDLNAGTASKVASFGAKKPITAGPEIAEIDGKKVLFFGTGRYLGEDDLSSQSTQSIYAIRDDGNTTVSDPSQLVSQSVSSSGNGTTRTVSNKVVDWTAKHGWYVDLPDSGERIIIEPQLYFGTLVVASIVPTASECQPGGYGWLYQLDYRTGGNVQGASKAAAKFISPIVGMTVSRLPAGTPVIYPITADGQKPAPVEMEVAPSGSTVGVKRVLWRVLYD